MCSVDGNFIQLETILLQVCSLLILHNELKDFNDTVMRLVVKT